MPHLALFQPDIPQNVGAAMRLCACLGLKLDLIEPFGFPWDERKIRQSGMDYTDLATVTRHASWETFLTHYNMCHPGESRGPDSNMDPDFRRDGTSTPKAPKPRRLILLTTKGAVPYTDLTYHPDDILIAGRESAGVPDEVHQKADARVVIPMTPGARSLNVIISSAIVLGEAIRQN